MGFRDRFYTARTARAILSWRLAVGAAVGVALGVAGLGVAVAIGAGVGVYVALVAGAMPGSPEPPRLDPFTVGEPWRQFVQGAQRAAIRVHDTVDATPPGPLRDRLVDIVARLDHGLAEAYGIARRGHELDTAVRRLDPTGLRSKLATLEAQRDSAPIDPDRLVDDQLADAIASVRSQLETVDRLEARSADTARRLRLTQTRLDELGARAAEVSLGAGDTDSYEHDVDDLVIELEGLRQAVEETNRP